MKIKAFTLIEVIIAVAIVCILLIPIGNLLQQVITTNTKAERDFYLTQAISKAYEEVMYFLKEVDPTFSGQAQISVNDTTGQLVYTVVYDVSNVDVFEVSHDVYSYKEELKRINFKVLDKKGNQVSSFTYFVRVSQ